MDRSEGGRQQRKQPRESAKDGERQPSVSKRVAFSFVRSGTFSSNTQRGHQGRPPIRSAPARDVAVNESQSGSREVVR